MIYLLCPGSEASAATIVEAALKRSFTASLVQSVSISHMKRMVELKQSACWVMINPPDTWSDIIIMASHLNNKILLFGSIPPLLSSHLEVQVEALTSELLNANQCPPALTGAYSSSPASVVYIRAVGAAEPPITERPFVRYDFTDEWNNLGYGAIGTDGSIWSISQQAQLPPHCMIAEITTGGGSALSAYCGLWDQPGSSVLWFNRPVGPVDSQEWRLVEVFLAHHRWHDLPCWPVISEIPYGYDAAVTMRLDCDEDVESARSLWHTYQRLGVPFSLALHATVLGNSRNHSLPREVRRDNGAILSHTATHAPNWGGSYAAAFLEGAHSAETINRITGHHVRYAVSPFHQTPDYARAGLADAGYSGCIGGIILNDPDFLMARAGVPPGSQQGFIGHSQQCMLHGDCMLSAGDPLAIFKTAFDNAKAGRSFFGYLDHPFSDRYSYGWQSEAQRSAMHEQFVAYIKQSGNVLFCNQEDAMDLLLEKSELTTRTKNGGFYIAPPTQRTARWPIAVEYAGMTYCIPEGGLII